MKVQNILFKILIFSILFFPFSFSQTPESGTVSGFVYDKATGETLIGATVSLSGNGIRTGAYTNSSGYFVISEAPAGKDTINVSYIGYNPSKTVVTVGGKHSGLLKFT